MPFDSQATPDLLPGQRLLRGETIIFNLDLFNAAVSDMDLELHTNADLTSLSDDVISRLWMSWLNASARRRRDHHVETFGVRICDERAKRPLAAAEQGRAA